MQKTPLAGLFFLHCAHQRSSLSQLTALFAMQEKYRSSNQAHERKSSRIEAKAREKNEFSNRYWHNKYYFL